MIIINKRKTLDTKEKSQPIGLQLPQLLAQKLSLQNGVSI